MLLASRTGDFHIQLINVKINVVVDINFENYQVILKRLDFIDAG